MSTNVSQLTLHPAQRRSKTLAATVPRPSLTGRFLVLLFLTLLAVTPATRAAERLLFVLSADKPVYHQLVDSALQRLRALGRAPTRADTRLLSELPASSPPPADTDLVIAVGTAASHDLNRRWPSVPMVETLLPESTARRLLEDAPPASERIALVLEQPPARQLDLIHELLPATRVVGVLLGPSSARDRERIERAIHSHGWKTVIATSRDPDQLGPALDRLLRQSDVILAIPDKLIFNRNTLYRLLLASYRRKIPVIGFSRAFVHSGALAAVHSTAEDIGKSLAESIASGLFETEDRILYPEHFHVSINRAVADSLGIHARGTDELTQRLRRHDR